MSDVLTNNGLPVEAQPWARKVERFMRDEREQQDRLARNTDAAITSSGNAVLASAAARQQQLADQYNIRRIPATLTIDDVVATPSTYFDSTGTPWGRIDIDVMPSDLDVDGNILVPSEYQAWVRVFFVDPGIPVDDKTTLGFGPPYQKLGSSPSAKIQVNGLQVGVTYQLRIVAVSPYGVSSSMSEYIVATTPETLAEMAAPSSPMLSTDLGAVVAAWDGKLGAALPPSQFRHVYAEVSPSGADTWERVGSVLLRGGGSIQITSLTVGQEYDVRFVGVDSLGTVASPSAPSTIIVQGVTVGSLDQEIGAAIEDAQTAANEALGVASEAQATADGRNRVFRQLADPEDGAITLAAGDVWFQEDAAGQVAGVHTYDGTSWNLLQLVADSVLVPGSAGAISLADGAVTAPKIVASDELWAKTVMFKQMSGENIEANTITVNELAPSVGDNLNLAANGTISLIAGSVAALTEDVDGASAAIGEMQTYYKFGATGAVIGSPSSPFELALRNDRIEMLESGTTVSYWNSGQMFVRSFVGDEVVLGNHKLEKYGTGTVVRKL